MSITTKKGDDGWTSLYWGGRVSKDSLRIEICGTLDELNAVLGLSKSLCRQGKIKRLIESVQNSLFLIGAEIATTPPNVRRLKRRIRVRDLKQMEDVLRQLERAKAFKEKGFYIPGNDKFSSSLDMARTVARRLERRAVTLVRKRGLKNKAIPIFLNRLSDLLYLLARKYERRHTPFVLENFVGIQKI